MKKTDEWAICKNIFTEEYTEEEKLNAINDVICGWATINSITKDDLVNVIRWMLGLLCEPKENINMNR